MSLRTEADALQEYISDIARMIMWQGRVEHLSEDALDEIEYCFYKGMSSKDATCWIAGYYYDGGPAWDDWEP